MIDCKDFTDAEVDISPMKLSCFTQRQNGNSSTRNLIGMLSFYDLRQEHNKHWLLGQSEIDNYNVLTFNYIRLGYS